MGFAFACSQDTLEARTALTGHDPATSRRHMPLSGKDAHGLHCVLAACLGVDARGGAWLGNQVTAAGNAGLTCTTSANSYGRRT